MKVIIKIDAIKTINENQFKKGLVLVKQDKKIYEKQVIEQSGKFVYNLVGKEQVEEFENKLDTCEDVNEVKKLIGTTLGYYRTDFSEQIVESLIKKKTLFDVMTDYDPYILNMLYDGFPDSNDVRYMLEEAEANHGFKVAKLTYNELGDFSEEFQKKILLDSWAGGYGSFDIEADGYSLLYEKLESEMIKQKVAKIKSNELEM